MKKLIQINILLLLLLSFYSTSYSQTDHIGNNAAMASHPRILWQKGEEDAIKKMVAGDAIYSRVQQELLKECDHMLDLPPIERIQIGRRLLDKSREALRRLFFLSYAYRVTGKDAYRQRAEKEMLAIAAFSDWNPSHFLDVAEMTMAVAIGYDWLYNALSPQSRSIIKEAIIKKGLEPSLDAKNNGWLTAEHNWNQVCNAGMTYGAMAVYEDQPALSKQIINRAIESIVTAMKEYAPDGAYPEGYGYWGYGTSFNVLFISALNKLFNQDFGLSNMPGFLRTGGYLENMTGPSGNPFNYSDAGSHPELHPAMFWFANKTNDPSLLWVERSYLMSKNLHPFMDERLLPALFLWSGGISIDKVQAPAANMWVGKGKNPVALMRTSWTEPLALYVAMKGGSASVNHAHMDIGSFVMEADGVRWAMDFGMQNYESLESKGVQVFGRRQDAQRWSIFRYNNRVHNTLTINNQLQRVDGYAPITRSSSAPSFMYATIDMSEVYKEQITKANRGIAIVQQQYVVVRDEIETTANETTISFTLLTPARVTITGDHTAELTKDGKKLLLQVQTPAAITMKTWSTEGPNAFDAPNPGTTLVGFETIVPANTKTGLTVLLIPEKAIGHVDGKVPPLKDWK